MPSLAITINDVDVSTMVVWDAGIVFEQFLRRRWTGEFAIDQPIAQPGQSVGAFLDGVRFFGGTIQDVLHEPPHLGPNGATWTPYRLPCVSWEIRLDTKYVENAVYGQVCYADDAANTLESRYHGLSDNQQIRFTTTDTLPAGLNAGTTYYVRDATAHTFKVATTPGGSEVDFADPGVGTHRFQWLAREVVSHLINTYAPFENIDVVSGTVEDGDFLDQIVIGFNSGISVSAALDTVAEICGFIWFIDPDLVFHFKSRTTTEAPWFIDDDNIHALGFTYRKTLQDYRNKQLIVGSFAGLSPEEEAFDGDGETKRWWLDKRAESIESITLNGEPATLGVDGPEAGVQFYWNPGERNLRAETAPAIGDVVVIRYRELGSNTYVVEDTAEQAARAAIEGGSGVRQHIVDDTANVDANGSVAKAQAELDANKTVAEEIGYTTDKDNLRVGQLQQVIVTTQGINGAYLIDQITIRALSRTLMHYTIRALGGTYLSDYVDYFKSLRNGFRRSLAAPKSSGGNTAPVWIGNFGIEVGGALTTSDDVTNRLDVGEGEDGAPFEITANQKDWSGSSTDTILDIEKRSPPDGFASILPTGDTNKIVIPFGVTEPVKVVVFEAGTYFVEGDQLSFDVVSGVANGVHVALKWRRASGQAPGVLDGGVTGGQGSPLIPAVL